MSSKVYRDSPIGPFVHPHLNRPDTKFNADGLFKVGLRLEGEVAEKLAALWDKEAEAAFQAWAEDEKQGGKLTPGERKKWEGFKPYTREEDDDGNPTGAILFNFRQNAKIKLKDGTVKDIDIALYDATGKGKVTKDIWGGSRGRINYSLRPIVMTSAKQVGVRADFGRVQVIELRSAGSGGEGGFGAVDGGYEDDGDTGSFGDQSGQQSSGGASSGSADY